MKLSELEVVELSIFPSLVTIVVSDVTEELLLLGETPLEPAASTEEEEEEEEINGAEGGGGGGAVIIDDDFFFFSFSVVVISSVEEVEEFEVRLSDDDEVVGSRGV